MNLRSIAVSLSLAVVCLQLAAQPACNTFVGGYVPSWRDPSKVDYSKLTHTFYAFGTATSNGGLNVSDPSVFSSFISASAGTQRFLSIGGGGDLSLAAMAGADQKRHQFVTSCLAFCLNNQLQGIDIDWEGIQTSDDSTHFGIFIRELTDSLHHHALKTTATVAYGDYGGNFYSAGSLKVADWIQLMVYDQTGTWAASPYGNHSTMQHVQEAIAYWTGRGYTDLSKIVIGLPFYGYQFKSLQGGLATGISYSDIINAHPNLSCDWDNVDLIEFNSPETMRTKVRYVATHGLKGVMIWEMGQDLPVTDSRSLLLAVDRANCDNSRACDHFITTGLDVTNSLEIYPNPVKKTLYLAGEGSAQPQSISVVDSFGRITTVNSTHNDGVMELDLAPFSSGLYVIRIQFDNATINTRVLKID